MTWRSTALLNRRPQWWLCLAIVTIGVCYGRPARLWALVYGGLFGLAIIAERFIAPRAAAARHGKMVARLRETYYGSFTATSSTLTHTLAGRSRSIDWNEIESVAYSNDPFTQSPEWWFRARRATGGLHSIPDFCEDRPRLLQYFAQYLPGFAPTVFDHAAREIKEDPEAVAVCWRRSSM
jgi:hypothetical protein